MFLLVQSLPVGNLIYAQPTVKLLLDPDTRTLSLGLEPKEVWIQAQLNGEDWQLTWEFQGPGEFQHVGTGGIYTAPEKIEDTSAIATIIVTATDDAGKTATDTVIFTLVPSPSLSTPLPEPTSPPIPTEMPTPTPLPTSTPTVTPAPTSTPEPTPTLSVAPTATPILEKIQQHLQNAETYLDKKWLMTPQAANAFDEYKAVLELDPANRDARQGLYVILDKYELWAEDEYKKGNYQRTKSLYQRYLLVADYMLNTLKEEEVRQKIQIVRTRLQR